MPARYPSAHVQGVPDIRQLAVLALGILLLGACDSASPARTPNVTARPSARATSSPIAETPPASSTAGTPSATPWSAEWHAAFCAAFADVVIAQQLVRDIGRSLEADDSDNATGLAHELQTTVRDLGTTIAALPAWPGSTNVVTAVTAMLEQDASLATQYLRYLEDKRSAALDRAHDVEGTLRTDAVPAVTVAVTALVTQGLTCPDTPLQLESP